MKLGSKKGNKCKRVRINSRRIIKDEKCQELIFAIIILLVCTHKLYIFKPTISASCQCTICSSIGLNQLHFLTVKHNNIKWERNEQGE